MENNIKIKLLAYTDRLDDVATDLVNAFHSDFSKLGIKDIEDFVQAEWDKLDVGAYLLNEHSHINNFITKYGWEKIFKDFITGAMFYFSKNLLQSLKDNLEDIIVATCINSLITDSTTNETITEKDVPKIYRKYLAYAQEICSTIEWEKCYILSRFN